MFGYHIEAKLVRNKKSKTATVPVEAPSIDLRESVKEGMKWFFIGTAGVVVTYVAASTIGTILVDSLRK